MNAPAFWDDVHQHGTHRYLTGSGWSDYAAHAGVDRLRYPPPRTVMEIGVGYGQFVAQVLAWGHRVIAVDLVPAALARLRACDACLPVLTRDLPAAVPGGVVDQVVSHLVLQHCEDEMVDFLLRHATRALRHDGVASMQFATRLAGAMPLWLQEEADSGLLHCRTVEDMTKRLLGVGGKDPVFSELMTFPNQQAVGWYVMGWTA